MEWNEGRSDPLTHLKFWCKKGKVGSPALKSKKNDHGRMSGNHLDTSPHP